MTLQRRTPLRSDPDKPLRSDPAKTREWQNRSRRPLPAESPKRKAERPERAAVRAEVHQRDQVCQGKAVVPEVDCWHPYGEPLDVDEIAGRGRYPGGHLDVDNCQLLCRAHHDWKTGHPAEAEARGLTRKPPLAKPGDSV